MSCSLKKDDVSTILIRDLQVGASVNFYGKVIFFKAPRKTRGKDYAMTIVVVDHSIKDQELHGDGLSVSIFKPDVEMFPKIQYIGDIVLFKHMKVID